MMGDETESGLIKLDDSIFCYEYSVKVMLGIRFPVRSTFIELDNNELLLISPGPFSEPFIRRVMNKYSTVYCIAPNNFHHLHVKKFSEFAPKAEIYGPDGLHKKQPWLANRLLGVEGIAGKLKGQVLLFTIHGIPALSETLFYCCRSQTLVVTDLLFNMRAPMSLKLSLLLRLSGANNKIAQSRMVKSLIKDKEAYISSLGALRDLSCRRIVVAHGDVIESANEIQAALDAIGVS